MYRIELSKMNGFALHNEYYAVFFLYFLYTTRPSRSS